jgi:hypothetical protein
VKLHSLGAPVVLALCLATGACGTVAEGPAFRFARPSETLTSAPTTDSSTVTNGAPGQRTGLATPTGPG